jgi:hypothetical protein
MRLRVIVDIDVSATMAETIERTGFSVCPDGTAMQIKVPNSPAIPKRKTKVECIQNPTASLKDLVKASTAVASEK